MSSRALINRPIESQPMAATQVARNLSNENSNVDVLDLLRRKFWLILTFVVVGIAASLIYFFFAPKTFESTAKLFVDEQYAPAVDATDNDEGDESTVAKYVEVIKSTRILQPAIDSGHFGTLNTFRDEDDILWLLREENILDVLPADTEHLSGVIELTFRGSDRAESKQVLDQIVDSFDQYIKSTTKNLGGETTRLVESMQGYFSGRLSEVNAEIRALMSRPELLFIDGNVVNPYQLQQTKIQEYLHELLRKRTKLTARVKKIRKSRELGINEELLMTDIMQDFNETSLGGYEATHDQYVNLKVKEQRMLNEFGLQHPELISLRRQIEMVNKLRMQELSALRGGQSVEASEDADDMIEVFLDLMDRKIEMLSMEEEGLKESLVAQQQKSQELSIEVEKLNTLQRERQQLELGYAAMVKRLNEIKAYESHLWRNMTVLDPPALGEQVAPSLPISLAGGLLLGCLVGFLFAGLRELAEKTFRSSEEVASTLDCSIVGQIPQFSKTRIRKNSSFSNIAPDLVTLHQPASQISERYRSIRTRLFFSCQANQSKVLQFTSPSPADGKSTTAANLAVSIAQAGRRVLLIDADLRKPIQHKLFGLNNDHGVSSIVAGEKDPQDCVQVFLPEYLSVVTSGKIPGNPAEMLTSARFAALIEQFRSEFDFVIIDSPPMLAVTDSSIIGGNVDLLYLVMRIRNGVREASLQAREIVDSVGIQLGGVIVNGLNRNEQKAFQYSAGRPYGVYRAGHHEFVAHPVKEDSVSAS